MICAVLVPSGKIAMGKLAQALVHGARLLQVEGNFDDCLKLARDLADHHPVSLVNSVNVFRIEGQKTAAFEVCDALGDAPDVLCRSATRATSRRTGRVMSSTPPTARAASGR
jgi:threonine synthase